MAYGALYDPNDPQSLVQQYSSLYTIGERNNNYGNLRSNDPFIGKTGSRGSYDLYDTPENGLRALARDLQTKSSNRGINNVNDLIDRYAPLADNPNNPQYKDFVAKALGVDINADVDITAMRPKIMDAIIRFENKGRSLASPQMINNAIAAADGISAPQPNTKGTPQMAANPQLEELKRRAAAGDEMAQMVLNNQQGVSANNTAPTSNQSLNPNDLNDVLNTIKISQMHALGGISQAYGHIPEVRQALAAKGVLSNTTPATSSATSPAPALLAQEASDDINSQGVLQQGAGNASMQAASDFGLGITAAKAGALHDYGTMTLPDGTVVVTPTGEGGPPMGEDPPLTSPEKEASPFQYLPATQEVSAASVSGNRRDKSPMSFDPAIDMNESLIRIGLAGVGGSQQGGLNALGKMGEMYGSIQDANRSNALSAYEASLEAGKAGDVSDEDTALADKIDATLFNMDQAMGFLERSKSGEGGGLTGWFDATIGSAWDSLKGNPEAMGRKILEQLRVDDALIRVAQTKGAISNHEMKLFLSPAPTNYQDEQVWMDWIKIRRDAAQRVLRRMRTGRRVASGDQASEAQANQYGSNNSNSEIDDLVTQYAS